ncbi:transcription factor Opi1-domain-containing protein, partial [Halteromyces radiatus]|uniref:transcription factor Opi1-domain-containing protein n=1 Tax=Halteromyces radiatus TaxID=101107 RepID=UPI002220ABC2
MTDHCSPMSITQLINNEPNQNDVRLAAEALGDLATSTKLSNSTNNTMKLPPLSVNYSIPSTTASSPLPTPSSCMSDPPRFSFSSDVSSVMEEEPLLSQQQEQPFIHRVSNISLVNSALRVYEKSTAQNVMKYGTDMVESFAAPIYDKFGKGAYATTTMTQDHHHDEETMAAVNALARTTLSDEMEPDGVRRRNGRLDEENINRKTRSRPHSRSTSPHRPYIKSTSSPRHHHLTHRSKLNKSTSSGSRWQRIVMHAGSAAGTTAAVVSEESMKCLRYCLHWLQYATQHIQQQMNLLRTFLVSLATSSNNSNNKTVSRQQQSSSASTLAAIQKEIILTLRKVVEVVSRYAGVGLPSHAKASVRSFILQLPSRWATLNNNTTKSHDVSGDDDTSSSTPTDGVPDHVKETSIKLLNFGGESVEMLESVSTVFSDSIDRAELWLDRLRVVGVTPVSPSLQKKQQQQQMHVDCMET